MDNLQNRESDLLARSGAGRETRPEQARKQADEGAHACISDIFSNTGDESQYLEYLDVSEGVSRVRRDFYVSENEFFVCGGGSGGRKGPIVTFSSKSRRNLMVTMAEMKRPFEYWQDFTFADDVMEGLSIKERAKKSAKILKAFKLWLDREGYKIHGVWKREWRPRKSGVNISQYIPHFHLLFTIEGTTEKEFFKLAKLFAHKWVEFTGTKNEKAFDVALHFNSFRLINSRKQANQYISDRKYISKNGEFVSDESIGRNWGYLGEPEFAEREKFYLHMSEMVLFRRVIRNFVRKNKRRFKRLISKKYRRFFVFIDRSTIHKVLEWIAQTQMNRAVEGVPF